MCWLHYVLASSILCALKSCLKYKAAYQNERTLLWVSSRLQLTVFIVFFFGGGLFPNFYVSKTEKEALFLFSHNTDVSYNMWHFLLSEF